MHAPFSAAIGSVFLVLAASHAAAQTSPPIPENTIRCKAFSKQPNGWYVGEATTFDAGNMKGLTFSRTLIRPNSVNVGGVMLYDVIEQKCGGRH
jgi:hypothetical protein